jgi:Cu+-exporting ATPase
VIGAGGPDTWAEKIDKKLYKILGIDKESKMKKILAVFALIVPLLLTGPVSAQESQAGQHGAAAQGKAEKPKAEKQKKSKTEKAVLRKITAEEIGKEAVCPVTGEKLTVKENTVSASYKGKIYYFCCPGCDKSFLANPEKFVSNKAASPAKVYVCPMGDYQGDKPGKCPKCGMTLEEKK